MKRYSAFGLLVGQKKQFWGHNFRLRETVMSIFHSFFFGPFSRLNNSSKKWSADKSIMKIIHSYSTTHYMPRPISTNTKLDNIFTCLHACITLPPATLSLDLNSCQYASSSFPCQISNCLLRWFVPFVIVFIGALGVQSERCQAIQFCQIPQAVSIPSPLTLW